MTDFVREEEISAFGTILEQFLRTEPKANAAVLVNRDGIFVDYATRSSVFDAKLAGASWAPSMHLVRLFCARHALGQCAEVVIRAEESCWVLLPIDVEHFLVINTLPTLERGFGELVNAIRREASVLPALRVSSNSDGSPHEILLHGRPQKIKCLLGRSVEKDRFWGEIHFFRIALRNDIEKTVAYLPREGRWIDISDPEMDG